MNLDTLFPFILVGIGIVIGFLIGALIFSLIRSEGDDAEKQKKLKNYTEGLRVWRNNNTGNLVPEFNGKRFRTVGSLSDQQHAHLAEIVSGLTKWMEIPSPTVPVEQEATDEKTPSPVSDDPALKEAESLPSFADSLPKPVGIREAMQVRPFQRKKETLPPIATEQLSIVAQINAILQEQIAGTPLGDNNVTIEEVPQGGLVIKSGLTTYEGVQTIDDPELKTAITKAVNTWNEKQN